ncbi:carbon starvation CstA family protein [Leadbettera azotonutricia]|uniref:Carbon starvation protein A n=1 Tax=Leadbettera azotonutricia (strain ATCC BAA-888 / DSM 13862 / ZAS-9) TaxID=545695 RepID=F5Y7B2_LEAAZ|nr:carbon starvation CstA family protein [Leadbettera azotonutricia]AEF82997.1 carbon starvation protein A [Leadbettera azotonutricia ZAS-9]
MNGLMLLIISVVVLVLAYLLYGRFLARSWGIDPSRKTPAQEFDDGMEYVSTSPAVVFGHEFASIAGAGPINGPIIAAMFGWVPVLLWLLFGSVFFGAVHDFAALYTSVKNKGKSIGYVIELYVGKTGKRLFLIFVWLFSILIAASFADIVAGTFAGLDTQGGQARTNASVASTSCLFIVAALGLGFFIRKRKASDLASGIIAVDLLIGCIVLGIFFPLFLPKSIWLYLVFGYIFTASVVPVWAMGQPRNYLNSFLLVAMILAAFIGVVFTNPEISIPAFTGFEVNGNYLFPALFITIACGAISGFHSLVATGAASKQINNERYMLPISYGAMLLETLVAVLALIAVGSLAIGGVFPQGTPPVIFATAVSAFLHQLGLPIQISYTVVSLAVSSFVLTTLDTVARLGRLAFQELFSPDGDAEPSKKRGLLARIATSKAASSLFTLLPAYLLAIMGYQNIWALFGAANQLLAALTLIACTLFFKKSGRRYLMLIVPTAIMLAVTYSSLVLIIKNKLGFLFSGNFNVAVDGLQLSIAALLLILGIMVAFSCTIKLLKKPPAAMGTAGQS